MYKKLSFKKKPLTTGIYVLRKSEKDLLCLVWVFFVPNPKSGEWFYADYPHAKEMIRIDEECVDYRWGFIES